MAKSTNNGAEWRSGRPSFKAFYPEVFILTVLTLVIIVFACRLSCNVVKNSKKAAKAAVPESVAVDSFFLTSFAYAQDESIDAAAPEEPTADAPATEPVADEPAPAEPAQEAPAAEESTGEKSVAEAPAADETPATQAPAEESAQADEASDVATNEPAPATPAPVAKKPVKGKLLGIWIPSLVIILALWIWRGWKWIVAVFGTEYELRVDEDNPRAATFLVKRGIFNKTTDSMHIGAIKDVQSSQSIWQKYLKGGVGTVKLLTKDLTDGVVIMDNMAEPSRVFNAFDTLRKHYWARGGMTLNGGGDDFSDADGGIDQADAEG